MGKIVATEFISLDGVIEDPGGSEDYVHGGWTFEIDRGEEGNEFKLGELEEAEAPAATAGSPTKASPPPGRSARRPADGRLRQEDRTRCRSTSTRPPSSRPTGRTPPSSSGDFAADIAKVKDEVDGVILVAGSAHLVQGLIADDLLDELRLMLFPVTLGGGLRLFADDGRKVPPGPRRRPHGRRRRPAPDLRADRA